MHRAAHRARVVWRKVGRTCSGTTRRMSNANSYCSILSRGRDIRVRLQACASHASDVTGRGCGGAPTTDASRCVSPLPLPLPTSAGRHPWHRFLSSEHADPMRSPVIIVKYCEERLDNRCGRSELKKRARRCQSIFGKKFSLTFPLTARSEHDAASTAIALDFVRSQVP